MEPESGASSPMMSLMKVDLPVPLSPSRAIRSPPATSRLMWLNRVRAPKDFFSSVTTRASSPWNSRSPNRVDSLRSFAGLSVVRIRSMRRSMLMARLYCLSLPLNAHRRICSAAASSWAILACSFSYCLSRS